MSAWLAPLSLKRKLRVCTPHPIESISDWTCFLIWAGWWMHNTIIRNKRIFFVLLLPTRISCSAFCALGALIGSIGKLKGGLTWEEFTHLPPGKKIYQYFRLPESSSAIEEREIEIGKKFQSHGQIFQSIHGGSGRNRSSELIYIENFYKYQFFLYKLKKKLGLKWQKMTRFFGDLKSRNTNYPMLFEKEYMIVTNRTEWKRQVSDIFVTTSKDSNALSLSQILMPCERDETDCPGFLFSYKGGDSNVKNVPLAILDGPDALKAWEKVSATNIIILLDQIEYDQNSQNILSLLASARDDRLIRSNEDIPECPPAGIEMSVFHIAAGI
jgi:hypothetical protein